MLKRRFLDIIKMAVTFKTFKIVNEMLNRWKESAEFAVNYPEISDISVSVIVPTKNEAKNIKRLLTILRTLNNRNLEVIVADYMSCDNTTTIARSLGAHVIELDKPGVGYASFIAANEEEET